MWVDSAHSLFRVNLEPKLGETRFQAWPAVGSRSPKGYFVGGDFLNQEPMHISSNSKSLRDNFLIFGPNPG